MEIYHMNILFSQEITDLLEQIKEELLSFFDCPEDQNLIDLICSDLLELEHQSTVLGMDELNTVTRELHDHLFMLGHCYVLSDKQDYDTCIKEIHNIERVLEAYSLAS